MNDFARYLAAQEIKNKWAAKREHASAAYSLALQEERMCELMSQHEPIASLGLDREALRAALQFIRNGVAK